MLEESLNGGGGMTTPCREPASEGFVLRDGLECLAAVYSECGPQPEGWVRGGGGVPTVRHEEDGMR